jgi:hypothetical protein
MKAAASPPPIFSNVKPTEIAGAIWLTRKNGESAVQRGAKVVLLPVKVSKASVQGALQSEASSHDDEAQSHGKTAEGFNREFGNDSGYGERARASRAAAVSCRSAVATVTADMDTRSAYRVLKSHAILEIPSFSSVRAQNVIDEAEADVDGKYLFEM